MPAGGTRKLYQPIILKDGRKIVTLDDARALMLKLSERTQLRPTWQYAGELVLNAAENNRASIKDAWVQLRRALIVRGIALIDATWRRPYLVGRRRRLTGPDAIAL